MTGLCEPRDELRACNRNMLHPEIRRIGTSRNQVLEHVENVVDCAVADGVNCNHSTEGKAVAGYGNIIRREAIRSHGVDI